MRETIAGYKKISLQERELEFKRWRTWTFDDSEIKEEKRLRKIISGAYLRLARLDDSNPEVNHAKEILEQALKGGAGSWP